MMDAADIDALAASLRKVLTARHDFPAGRERNLAAPPEAPAPLESALAELGLPALAVPEAYGGVGAGIGALQAVQRELGRALASSSWLGTSLCALALESAASEAQRGTWLPSLAEGRLRAAWAGLEANPLDRPAITRAVPHGSGWRIEGCKYPVAQGACCGLFLVTATLPTQERGLFAVEAPQGGISIRSHRLVDGAWSAEVRFDAAPAVRLGSNAEIDAIERSALACATAELAGSVDAAFEATVRYLRERKQFDQPLADYQALRHRVAEMYIEREQLQSAVELSAEAATRRDDGRAARAWTVGIDAALAILRQSIQLHGGMGMSEALPIGHHYRRALVLDALHADAKARALAPTARAA